jgi:hypothetical protein
MRSRCAICRPEGVARTARLRAVQYGDIRDDGLRVQTPGVLPLLLHGACKTQ